MVKKASKSAKATTAKATSRVAEKSGDPVRKRLRGYAPQTPRVRSQATKAKITRDEVNSFINNLISRG